MEQSPGSDRGMTDSGRGFTTAHASTGSGSSTASLPQPTMRGIDQGGWSIRVTSGPIGSSAEMDALSDVLGIPPPEMAFPHNCLVLQHHQSGFSLCFDAVRTLRSVDGVKAENYLQGVDCRASGNEKPKRSAKPGEKPKPGTGGSKSSIKVAYAKEWGKSRNDFTQTDGEGSAAAQDLAAAPASFFGSDVAKKAVAAQTADISAAKDYDWTYSTTWAGSIGDTAPQPLLSSSPPTAPSTSTKEWFAPGTDPVRDRIPVERLGPSSGEPILFYDDIVLFEDELADNGSSMVNIKVRVMPSGFLVLQRFFLRVDDVVFRVFDTRLYCQFNDPKTKLAGSSRQHDNALPSGLSNLSLGESTTSDVDMVEKTTTAAQQSAPQRLIRECSGSEATYAEVRAHLPPYKPNDLSPLTDVQWVSNVLTKISQGRAAQYRAGVASGNQLPKMHSAEASAGTKFLSASTATGFPGNRPGERVDLSPARAPAYGGLTGAPWAQTSTRSGGTNAPAQDAQIIGEVAQEESDASQWAGNGARVDVAVLA